MKPIRQLRFRLRPMLRVSAFLVVCLLLEAWAAPWSCQTYTTGPNVQVEYSYNATPVAGQTISNGSVNLTCSTTYQGNACVLITLIPLSSQRFVGTPSVTVTPSSGGPTSLTVLCGIPIPGGGWNTTYNPDGICLAGPTKLAAGTYVLSVSASMGPNPPNGSSSPVSCSPPMTIAPFSAPQSDQVLFNLQCAA